METKKRKYVKPKLTVAEWDFNEAVCQSQTFCISECVTSETGTIHRYVNVNESNWNGIHWQDYNETNNN